MKRLIEKIVTNWQLLALIITVLILIITAFFHWLGWNPVFRLTGLFFVGLYIVTIFSWQASIRKIIYTTLGFILLEYIISLINAKTGWFFGNLKYQNHLGLKLFNVPVLVGLYWLVITFSAWNMALYVRKILYRLLIYLMVIISFDMLLERVSSNLNYWSWINATIPMKNYISWAILSIFIFIFYENFFKKTTAQLFSIVLLPILTIFLYLILVIDIL